MLGKTRMFKTMIKNDESVREHWRNNEYIEGSISGIMYAICGKDSCPYVMNENGLILLTVCKPKTYAKFMTMIEKIYPELCEFDYEGED